MDNLIIKGSNICHIYSYNKEMGVDNYVDKPTLIHTPGSVLLVVLLMHTLFTCLSTSRDSLHYAVHNVSELNIVIQEFFNRLAGVYHSCVISTAKAVAYLL